MTTETNIQTQFAVRGLARIKAVPQWKHLSWFTQQVLTLKLEQTGGDTLKAISILQPRASDAENRELASAILSNADVAFMEHILGLTFEELERENAAKG
jgi:hypothetical protein